MDAPRSLPRPSELSHGRHPGRVGGVVAEEQHRAQVSIVRELPHGVALVQSQWGYDLQHHLAPERVEAVGVGRVGQGGLESPGYVMRVAGEPEVYGRAQRLSLPRDRRVVDPRPDMLQDGGDRLPVFGGSGLDPQSAIVQVLDAVAAHEGRAGQVDLARKVGELPA